MAERALVIAFFIVSALYVVENISILRIKKPKYPHCIAFVLPHNDPDELEALLMYTYSRLKCGFNREGALYFVNDNATEEEIEIAKAFCKDHYGAKIISKENLQDILGDSVYKTARFVLY